LGRSSSVEPQPQTLKGAAALFMRVVVGTVCLQKAIASFTASHSRPFPITGYAALEPSRFAGSWAQA